MLQAGISWASAETSPTRIEASPLPCPQRISHLVYLYEPCKQREFPASTNRALEQAVKILILHPPVLPFGYTLHHRFQRVWEVGAYVRGLYPETTIVDAGLLNMLQGEILSEFMQSYDAVCVYAEPQMIPTVLDLVERCRYISPHSRILVYGPATHTFPALLKVPHVDALARRGDPEKQITQFLRYTQTPDRTTPTNLCVRREERWFESEGQPELLSSEQWQFPPLREMPLSDIERIYQMKGQPFTVTVTASRGCPYQCTFCATPRFEGAPDRRRSAAALVDYISHNTAYRNWQLYSPTFTLDRQWCMQFLDLLHKAGVDIHWKCTTRVDRLDEPLVQKMAASGCYMIGLGVETLGPALDKVKKHITKEQMATSFDLLTKYGITPKAYVILGLPGQSLADVEETVDFVTSHGAQVRATLYSPQGQANELENAQNKSVDLQMISGIDRKSFSIDRNGYGEFLRIAFGGYRNSAGPRQIN
jgi:anaerobic magnesium-protoporphyrin IX monomethyl ester cyclase